VKEVAADRLSVHEGDPGFLQYVELGGDSAKIKIFLDGVEQRDCVTADRAQGWVRRFKRLDGMPVIVDYRFAEEVVYGVVEFKLDEDGE
jgi:hypothetical protein